MRSYARDVGGFRAADDLGMNRTSMYRAIRTGISSAIIEHDEPSWQRQAQVVNGHLREQGKTREEVDTWWNSTILPALNYRTPMQAWKAGDREAVVISWHKAPVLNPARVTSCRSALTRGPQPE